jgi:hypothetical protein
MHLSLSEVTKKERNIWVYDFETEVTSLLPCWGSNPGPCPLDKHFITEQYPGPYSYSQNINKIWDMSLGWEAETMQCR